MILPAWRTSIVFDSNFLKSSTYFSVEMAIKTHWWLWGVLTIIELIWTSSPLVNSAIAVIIFLYLLSSLNHHCSECVPVCARRMWLWWKQSTALTTSILLRDVCGRQKECQLYICLAVAINFHRQISVSPKSLCIDQTTYGTHVKCAIAVVIAWNFTIETIRGA